MSVNKVKVYDTLSKAYKDGWRMGSPKVSAYVRGEIKQSSYIIGEAPVYVDESIAPGRLYFEAPSFCYPHLIQRIYLDYECFELTWEDYINYHKDFAKWELEVAQAHLKEVLGE